MADDDIKQKYSSRLARILSTDVGAASKQAANSAANKVANLPGIRQAASTGKLLNENTQTLQKAAGAIGKTTKVLGAGIGGTAAGMIGGAGLKTQAAAGAVSGAAFGAAGKLGNWAMGKALDVWSVAMLYLAAIAVYLLDFFSSNGFDGYKFVGKMNDSLFGIFIPNIPWTDFLMDKLALVLIVFAVFLSFKRGLIDSVKTAISWIILIYLFVFILRMGLWNSGLWHLVLAVIIYVALIRKKSNTVAEANFALAAFVFLDFFGYGIIIQLLEISNEFITNRLIVPLWLYVVVWYTKDDPKNWLTKFILILLVILNVFAVAGAAGFGVSSVQADTLDSAEKQAAVQYFVTAYNNMIEKIKLGGEQIRYGFNQSLYDATGGYIARGEQEQVYEEPLGIYIENIEPASSKFYQDEPVVIWGTIRAKTYQDTGHTIRLNCSVMKAGRGQIRPERMASPFKVHNLEEDSFECGFTEGVVKPGSHTANITANFDFTTKAYLKTYFMDIERMRALRRSNIDILDNYGITDTNPIATSTQGPVTIGIGSNENLPIGIGEKGQQPRFGITLKNEWNGQIKAVNSLKVILPPGIGLEPNVGTDTYCNGWFKRVQSDAGEETLNTFEITPAGIKKFELPIKDHNSIRCVIRIPVEETNQVLGNAPIAIQYYRAEADYVYEIVETTTVTVEKDETKGVVAGCNDVCTKEFGCECPVSCSAKFASKDQTCGGLQLGTVIEGAPKFDSIDVAYNANIYSKGSNINAVAGSQIEFIVRKVEYKQDVLNYNLNFFLNDEKVEGINPIWGKDGENWAFRVSGLTVPPIPGSYQLKIDVVDPSINGPSNVVGSQIHLITIVSQAGTTT